MESSNSVQMTFNITEEDVNLILNKYGYNNDNIILQSYEISKNSDKMLGFVSDYWKLKLCVINNKEEEIRNIYFFIKAIPKSNEAKADMVREYNLFQKELFFYNDIKPLLDLPGLKPWSAKFVTTIPDAMVFEHLNELQYKLRNKFERFDTAHTLQSLKTMSRFHASSIIFEENQSKRSEHPYRFNDHFEKWLDKGGYCKTSDWFIQCMHGALEAIRMFSKYRNNEEIMAVIESSWQNIWCSAMELSNVSTKHRNVICHRDLWNNNILFHYKIENDGSYTPDDCLLVDFPGVRCQPPAGDIMFFLYCNLDPTFRQQYMKTFLNFYYQELEIILSSQNIMIDKIIPKEQFLLSAKEQQLWGNIVCACLMPAFWLDEDLTTDIFCDTEKFNDIMTKNKGAFITKTMTSNPDYKYKVLEIYEEIIEKYCLNKSDTSVF